jgi:uncharacterized protein
LAVIADTSFLVSLTNPLEQHHDVCVQAARRLRQGLVLPVTVLPEVTYLIARHISHRAMRRFVNQLRDPQWHLENLSSSDLHRAAQVLEQYKDAALDFTDATIVAMAERLNVSIVLTLDQRDFRMIRPKHIDYFTVLP